MTIPEKAAAGAGARGRLWLPHAVVRAGPWRGGRPIMGPHMCPGVAGPQIGSGEREEYEKLREKCPAVATTGCFSCP